MSGLNLITQSGDVVHGFTNLCFRSRDVLNGQGTFWILQDGTDREFTDGIEDSTSVWNVAMFDGKVLVGTLVPVPFHLSSKQRDGLRCSYGLML